MESLASTLIVPDMKAKIASLKSYIKSANKHGTGASSFVSIIKEKNLLPIKRSNYCGKVAYINWITRGRTIYLNLNVCYDSFGYIKSFEVMTKGLVIKKVFDVRRIRTIDGKIFKRHTSLSKDNKVYFVDTKKLYAGKPIKLLENGLENFASREKILKKFDVQSSQHGI